MKLVTLLTLCLSSSFAYADCPKNINEYAAYLVQYTSKKSHGQVSDYSNNLTNVGTIGKDEKYFVSTRNGTETISGLVICDHKKNKLVATHVGWASDIGFGVTGEADGN